MKQYATEQELHSEGLHVWTWLAADGYRYIVHREGVQYDADVPFRSLAGAWDAALVVAGLREEVRG